MLNKTPRHRSGDYVSVDAAKAAVHRVGRWIKKAERQGLTGKDCPSHIREAAKLARIKI